MDLKSQGKQMKQINKIPNKKGYSPLFTKHWLNSLSDERKAEIKEYIQGVIYGSMPEEEIETKFTNEGDDMINGITKGIVLND